MKDDECLGHMECAGFGKGREQEVNSIGIEKSAT